MKILAIDTSTKFLSVAIAENERILASFRDDGNLRHSDSLIPTLNNLLKKCRLKLQDIGAIALSIGPGSFTGLRIGVASCKAINLALGIPIAAVPTLDVISYNFISEKERLLCPLIDAKKAKVYTSIYKPAGRTHLTGQAEIGRLERISDYMLAEAKEALDKIDSPTLVFGDAIVLYGDLLKKNSLISISKKDWYPKAEIVAMLGFWKAEKRQFANPDKLVPMYMHSRYCQIAPHLRVKGRR